MRAKARPGITLRRAEELRQWVWSQPYDRRRTAAAGAPSDWCPVTKRYPADPAGVCRHKVSWLHHHLGGVPLYGRRTDKSNPEMHCVLLITIAGHEFVLDERGTWPAKGFPFQLDPNHVAYRR